MIALALVHHRERQAGHDAAAVDQDRAGAALAEAAALLGPGQVQAVAQGVEQRGARVDGETMILAVDGQRHREGVLGVSRGIWRAVPVDL